MGGCRFINEVGALCIHVDTSLRSGGPAPTFVDVKSFKVVAYLAGILLGVIYIVNPGAGVVELLPDNLPGVGNLDEAAMTALLLTCLRALREMRAESKAKEALPVAPPSTHEV